MIGHERSVNAFRAMFHRTDGCHFLPGGCFCDQLDSFRILYSLFERVQLRRIQRFVRDVLPKSYKLDYTGYLFTYTKEGIRAWTPPEKYFEHPQEYDVVSRNTHQVLVCGNRHGCMKWVSIRVIQNYYKDYQKYIHKIRSTGESTSTGFSFESSCSRSTQ
jgi:hypothetical protein